MGEESKRVAVCGGGASIEDRSAGVRLLTSRIRRGPGAQARRATQSETEERRGAKNVSCEYALSSWNRSRAKRAMDIAIVLAFSPILFPVLAAIALAVLVTSGAPIFFRQERVGSHGVPFPIYKFRTMRPALVQPPSAMAIASAGRITRLGAFLRKSKLDELPQVFNVLAGDMSLVGPRPKVPEQQPTPFPCRPGLTGAATLAFAREETLLLRIASADLDEYFNKTILSAKKDLDADYLRQATLWSDFRILINTALGRWESRIPAAFWLQGQEKNLEASSQTALCHDD